MVYMYGRSNDSGRLVQLSLRVVELPDERLGFAINQGMSNIPDEIELVAPQSEDIVCHHGRQVWISNGNGLYLFFEGDLYPLVKPLQWDEEVGGLIVYFGFLPFDPPKSDGAIRYSGVFFGKINLMDKKEIEIRGKLKRDEFGKIFSRLRNEGGSSFECFRFR